MQLESYYDQFLEGTQPQTFQLAEYTPLLVLYVAESFPNKVDPLVTAIQHTCIFTHILAIFPSQMH